MLNVNITSTYYIIYHKLRKSQQRYKTIYCLKYYCDVLLYTTEIITA